MDLEKNQIRRVLCNGYTAHVVGHFRWIGIPAQPDVAGGPIILFGSHREVGLDLPVVAIGFFAHDQIREIGGGVHRAHRLEQEAGPDRSGLVDVELPIVNLRVGALSATASHRKVAERKTSRAIFSGACPSSTQADAAAECGTVQRRIIALSGVVETFINKEARLRTGGDHQRQPGEGQLFEGTRDRADGTEWLLKCFIRDFHAGVL